jgi:uncharacterized protein YggE
MPKKSIIMVEATGTASARPDVARVRLSTFAEDPAPEEALTSCSLLTERVLSALGDADVAPSDLATTSINLSQQHAKIGEEIVQHYRASAGLLATVRRPADAGRIVAAAVQAAGTGVGIDDVSFDIDDRGPVTSLARHDAVDRAMNAARELATSAGLLLGPLVKLAEGGGLQPRFGPGPLMMRRGHIAQTLSGPPLELGELSVAVTVAAVFEVAGIPSS